MYAIGVCLGILAAFLLTEDIAQTIVIYIIGIAVARGVEFPDPAAIPASISLGVLQGCLALC